MIKRTIYSSIIKEGLPDRGTLLLKFLLIWLCFALSLKPASLHQNIAEQSPNFIVIYTDDHRWDALGKSGNALIDTPNIDSLANSGYYFPNSFVTLSICTPSRAAFLTGRYGSRNGVMSQRQNTVKRGLKSVAHYFQEAGYKTSVFGKWHISNSPESMGFDYEYYFHGLVPYWDVEYTLNGQKVKTKGFVEDVTVEGATDYLREISGSNDPFFMWLNTWAPHMDEDFSWPAKGRTLTRYPTESMPLPVTWPPDFSGKPQYIKSNRPHQRALEYGYSRSYPLKSHIRGYYAAVTDMDAALGKLFETVDQLGLSENTYIILMGDNGWFMGEHGLTSKVLAYEESIRVPLIVSGPKVQSSESDELMLNIDIMPTALDLAGIHIPSDIQGKSFKHLLGTGNTKEGPWRDHVFYEAPVPVHGTQPHYAIRTKEWKLIQTYDLKKPDELIFEELYHIASDPNETNNLSMNPEQKPILDSLRVLLEERIKKSREAASI
ncbi:sulfatase-like hydrolase/transferase [Aliifodinibius sp. S!AR15-10]|uniref:sulfatase-like hydrolase/transferase n=1 Tax=Aliifodinibius sp. S!AR15-10 TaxID=2950437 RepID=UPI002854DB5A|nr:sulfatase-like hydrolase/transferase [Aliifodinibius sp. S!AR15-10]MDR8390375.1 sulfatase-like hydrolase/transferase [Aliifodinibius sp. S!AR15-10]